MGLLVPLFAASALVGPVLSEDIASADVAVVTGPGTGVYEVFIAPDGWVEDCRVMRSDYPAASNARVCDALMQQKARKPALGADGKPIHAAATVTRSRGSAPAGPEADVVVEVVALPGAADGRRTVALNLLVDAHGRLSQCQPVIGAADALSRVACEQARGLRLGARKNPHGRAVPYLVQVRVDFVQGSASS